MKWLLILWGGCGIAVASDHKVPQAYRSVAAYHGVPHRILYAIALTESQRMITAGVIRPWPWTLNVAGQGRYFDSARSMQQAVYEATSQGVTNIDIGLMQINVGYHLHRAYSLDDLMRPQDNLNIAAEILLDEWRACDGDWWCAVGRYHSRDQRRARHYRSKVRRWYDQVS